MAMAVPRSQRLKAGKNEVGKGLLKAAERWKMRKKKLEDAVQKKFRSIEYGVLFFGVERRYPIGLKFKYEFLELCVRSLTLTSLQLFAADLLDFSEIRQDKESISFMLGFNWIYIYILYIGFLFVSLQVKNGTFVFVCK